MKTTKSLSLLLATAALALTGSIAAFGQADTAAPSDAPAKPAHRGGGRPPLPPEIRDKYDVNKDGKLDETERAALKADIDSGKVTLPKRGPGGPGGPGGPEGKGGKGGKGRPVSKEALEKYDANKDGKLDATERATMKADIDSGAFVPPQRPHGRPEGRPEGHPEDAPASKQ